MAIELIKENKGITLQNEQDNLSLKRALKGDKGDKGDKGEKGEKGDKGEAGANGFSPKIKETRTPEGYLITVTNEDESSYFFLHNGEAGEKGDTGATGFSPSVTFEPLENNAGYLYTVTNRGGAKQHYLFNGAKGDNGISPIITTSETENGYYLNIRDVEGYKSIEIKNGKDGEGGKNLQLKSKYFANDWVEGIVVSGIIGTYDFHIMISEELPDNIIPVDIGIWYPLEEGEEPREFRGYDLYQYSLLGHDIAYIDIFNKPKLDDGWGYYVLARGYDNCDGLIYQDYQYGEYKIAGFTLYYIETAEGVTE